MPKSTLSRAAARSPEFGRRSGSAPSLRVVKAWAIVDDETGRLMLRTVETLPGQRTEMPCIWLKRSEADYYKSTGERIVRVAITEIAK